MSLSQDGVLHRIVSRTQIPRSILTIVLKSEACDINLQNETGETALMVALEQVRLVATLGYFRRSSFKTYFLSVMLCTKPEALGKIVIFYMNSDSLSL